MPLVSSRTITTIQKIAAQYFKDTCTLEHQQHGTGIYGEPSSAWEVLATAVPCRIISIGGRFRTSSENVGDQNTIRDNYRLIVPVSTPLDADQRVIIASTGEIFTIASIQGETTDHVFKEALITRQRGDSQ